MPLALKLCPTTCAAAVVLSWLLKQRKQNCPTNGVSQQAKGGRSDSSSATRHSNSTARPQQGPGRQSRHLQSIRPTTALTVASAVGLPAPNSAVAPLSDASGTPTKQHVHNRNELCSDHMPPNHKHRALLGGCCRCEDSTTCSSHAATAGVLRDPRLKTQDSRLKSQESRLRSSRSELAPMLVQQQRILGQAKTAAGQESKRARQYMNVRLGGA